MQNWLPSIFDIVFFFFIRNTLVNNVRSQPSIRDSVHHFQHNTACVQLTKAVVGNNNNNKKPEEAEEKRKKEKERKKDDFVVQSTKLAVQYVSSWL